MDNTNQAPTAPPSESTDTQGKQTIGFLDLPLELRDEIYLLALTRPHPITVPVGYKEHQPPKDIQERIHTSVLPRYAFSTSRQVHVEAAAYLYKKNNFIICLRSVNDLLHASSVFPWTYAPFLDKPITLEIQESPRPTILARVWPLIAKAVQDCLYAYPFVPHIALIFVKRPVIDACVADPWVQELRKRDGELSYKYRARIAKWARDFYRIRRAVPGRLHMRFRTDETCICRRQIGIVHRQVLASPNSYVDDGPVSSHTGNLPTSWFQEGL